MSSLICVVDDAGENAACQIRLGGDLSVSHAANVHQALLSVVEKHPRVDVLLQDVTAFDLSIMQILLSAQKDSTTAVRIRMGENSDCATHWLNVAGLSSALCLEAA
jgi:anti-anti-sigma regulatory factor